MAKVIIGIGGAKRSGKNTCASYLVDKYGFTELAFAGPLKQLCEETFILGSEYFNDQELKEKPLWQPITISLDDVMYMRSALNDRYDVEITGDHALAMANLANGKKFNTPREILQFVGTELVRNCVDRDYWIKAMTNDVRGHARVVVTDCRFPNERQLIRDLGGHLIRTDRSGLATGDTHASETLLGDESEYDLVLKNDGTIAELHRTLENWYLNGEKKRA